MEAPCYSFLTKSAKIKHFGYVIDSMPRYSFLTKSAKIKHRHRK